MIRGAVAIFKRDFKKFLSNPFVVIMTLMMPIMYLVIFGNAFGGTISHVPVGVVQEAPPFNNTPLFTEATEHSITYHRKTVPNYWTLLYMLMKHRQNVIWLKD